MIPRPGDGPLVLGLLIAFALLVGVAVLALVNIDRQQEAVASVERTYVVIERLQDVEHGLLDAESARRGYLLEGDERHASSFEPASSRAFAAIEHVRRSAAGDAAQTREIDELAALVRERLDWLRQSIVLRRNAPDATGAQRARIAEILRRMEEEEHASLNARLSDQEASSARARFTIALAGAVAIAFGGVSVAVARRNIRLRQRAQNRLRDVMNELARSNRELSDFASVASHDLQEPLRKIQAFGDRLKARCSDRLGDDGRDYVERMQRAAARMQTLIDELLAFSRVSRTRAPFSSVDLARIAREVVGDLEARVAATGASVIVGEMPVIEADAMQMRQLLQNLIGNALKFRKPDVPPVVRVEAHVLGGRDKRCVLTVADNGIGFDEKYLDRIFAVFQRLHGKDEYEGTGVGLAICRRIAERHNGSITAKSAPGQGATFVVTLPVEHAASEPEVRIARTDCTPAA